MKVSAAGWRLSVGLVIGALLVGVCAACGRPASAAPKADVRPLVLTTFTVLADIARQVAGRHLRVESITRVGAEIHEYQPTPADLRRVAAADLVLDNGLGLEAWFSRLFATRKVPHVMVSSTITPISVAPGGPPNPHAWMSPVNVARYVEVMARAFGELDPAHRDDFVLNGLRYGHQLEAVQTELERGLARLPARSRILLSCEGAFTYLTREAGMDEAYLWPVNAERQATPRRVAAVIDVVRSRGVPAVFCESTVSDVAMRQVARETGARFGGVLYVDSLSGPDGPVPTYLDLMRRNVNTILRALGGPDGEGTR